MSVTRIEWAARRGPMKPILSPPPNWLGHFMVRWKLLFSQNWDYIPGASMALKPMGRHVPLTGAGQDEQQKKVDGGKLLDDSLRSGDEPVLLNVCQAFPDGIFSEFGDGSYLQFLHYMMSMGFDGFGAYVHDIGNLNGGFPFSYKL